MIQDINILEELFYSPEIWGYLGPLGFVVAGFFLAKKDKLLGIMWYVVCLLMTMTYFGKLDVTPNFIWHALFLIFGGFASCILPILDD